MLTGANEKHGRVAVRIADAALQRQQKKGARRMAEDRKRPKAEPQVTGPDADQEDEGESKGLTLDFQIETDWPDKEIDHLIRDDTRIEIDGIVITKKDLIDGPDSSE